MTLSARAESLVHQLVIELGIQALKPESLGIHFDKAGTPQQVKPRLSFERRKAERADAPCGG